MKKQTRVLGAIAVLIFIISCSYLAVGSGGIGIYKNYSKQEESQIKATEPNEVLRNPICNVTLVTGDVVVVSRLPDGRRGFAIKPAGTTKLRQNFRAVKTPDGTYIFPEGVDLNKLDKELFNIDYLLQEGYCNLTCLPVIVEYEDIDRRIFSVTEREKLEKEVNITIVKSYHALPMFSAKLSYDDINRTFKTLVENPEISKIWLDKKVKACLFKSVPLIGAPKLWRSGYNGSGLEIAILDTGIDDTHPDLDDLDDNPGTHDPKVIVKKNFSSDNTTKDLYGHGTHCAGIAAGTGAAPAPTRNFPIPSLSSNFTGTDTHVVEANKPVFEKEKIYASINTTPDDFELDNNSQLANWIPTNGTEQYHNFHAPGDVDYVKFNATGDITYIIETSDLGNRSDTYMYLCDTDGYTEITHDDNDGEGLASRIRWKCDTSGTYYVKVRHYNSSASGPNTNYNISVRIPRYIGVAPAACLWNVKVLNQYGWGYESDIVEGVEYAAYGPDGESHTGDEADIISMSLGGPPTNGTDPLSQSVNDAVEQGSVAVVAAGNSGYRGYFTVGTPGVADKVITVGASDKEDDLAYFSSKGPTPDLRIKPDVVAPGVDIVAPRANNTTMGYPCNDYYTEASGTSMATPHVAGAAALILEAHPDWTPKEVKNALISTAKDLDHHGYFDLDYNVYEQGGGRIYVPSAANLSIMIDPATISFGNLDNTTNETITFKNLDTTPHNLTLDVKVEEIFNDTEVDCARLNRTRLSIAPDSTTSVLLNINATSLPYSSIYSGKVLANYSGEKLHSIFGFCTLNKVTVKKINMSGEPAANELVEIFSVEYEYPRLGLRSDYGITDEDGSVVFYLLDGVYHVISGWGDIQGASVYTIAENVSIESDTNIILDERDTKVIDFDYNKPGQIMSEKFDGVYYYGGYYGGCSLCCYPKRTETYISPTNSFNSIFAYSYYPEERYNETEPDLINAPEWHKLLYNLSTITGNVTLRADYNRLIERSTDYKVALEPEFAYWYCLAWHPDMWCSGTYIYEMNAPLHRLEWLSPNPVSYSGGYEQYTECEWCHGIYLYRDPDWVYIIPEQSYPEGSKICFTVGEHPFKSGAEIGISRHWLSIHGTISEDVFGNSFVNASSEVSGNLTVIKDGEVVVEDRDIKDLFYYSTHLPPRESAAFKVIIQGNSSPRLSTYTRTELSFTADSLRVYHAPMVTLRTLGSDLYNRAPGGDVKLRMDVSESRNIQNVTLEYSLDNGTTWNSSLISYKGIIGGEPIGGCNRIIVTNYIIPTLSKVRIFMDDTENNDGIYYNYDFVLRGSNGTEYTKSGTSEWTLGDINDTLYYDEDEDGILDLFKSIRIGAYTEDSDTLDLKVEGWNRSRTAWDCLYGRKIREYIADLGYINDTFVSLRANATDTLGNSIVQEVIRGFKVTKAKGFPIDVVTREVLCEESKHGGLLQNVKISVYNSTTGELVTSVRSDANGNCTAEIPEHGGYELIANKTGFNNVTREVLVMNETSSMNFRGNYGLVPEDPKMYYVLECINHWRYPPECHPECALEMEKVLDVINEWQH